MPVPKLVIYHGIDLPSNQDIKTFDLGRAATSSAKHAHQKMGELWQRKMLPQHFGANAAARYGYQPRTAKYTASKQPGKSVWRSRSGITQTPEYDVRSGQMRYRRFKQGWRDTIEGGPNDANVFTGALKRTMLKSPQFEAYPTRVTIHMPALPYVFKNNPASSKRGRQPDKHQEIAASFTHGEMQELAKEFQWQFWWDFLGKLKRKNLTITGSGGVSIALR